MAKPALQRKYRAGFRIVVAATWARPDAAWFCEVAEQQILLACFEQRLGNQPICP